MAESDHYDFQLFLPLGSDVDTDFSNYHQYIVRCILELRGLGFDGESISRAMSISADTADTILRGISHRKWSGICDPEDFRYGISTPITSHQAQAILNILTSL